MPRDRLEASIYFNNCHSHLSAALEIQQRYSSFLVDRAGSEVVYTQSRDKYQPMMLPKICASKSKKEFCRHLGLSESDERDRRLYREMMDEAASARERLCSNPFNLLSQHRNNPNLKPPYSSAMFTESAIFQEVQTIYHMASPQTKYLYNKGICQEGPNIDNWVIRWCLWHVFRYRDDRNRNRSNRGSYYPVLGDALDNDDAFETTASSSGVYDPVRNVYREQ